MSSIVSPKGYNFSVASAGFGKPGRKDIALVISKTPAVAAAMFTTNSFCAAPVQKGKQLIEKFGLFRGILINSGNANACTGAEGLANCQAAMEMVAKEFDLAAHEVLPASTGVIGNQFNMQLWKDALPELVSTYGKCTAQDFAAAIMTTDRFSKIVSEQVLIEGKTVTLTGIAKGAGMICPNMATMLSALLCDADIDPVLWNELVKKAVSITFNRASVDGDTSTNDTIYALANGASGVKVTPSNFEKLFEAVSNILGQLAYMLVQDGEGATKVMEIKVHGAISDEEAEIAARTIGHSPLVKTAMFGEDANWGRIIAALGRSGCQYTPENVILHVCGFELFRNGQPCMDVTRDGDDPKLVAALKERDILIEISLGSGPGTYTLLASDLTLDYVKLNADYRS